MFLSLYFTAAMLATAPQSPAPRPGALKTFGDWTVGCDNGLECQAVALVPENADRDSYLLMVLTRGARGETTRMGFALMDHVRAGRPYAITVDGKPIARAVAAGKPPENAADAVLDLDAKALAALRNGKRAAIAGTKISASLTGLAAALGYMDAQQARGTPALPVVTLPPASSRAPRTLPAARALAALPSEARTCDDPTNDLKPEASRLDARHSLVLIAHPCGNGAYNLFSTALIVDEAGRATPARFDADPGMGGSEVGGSLVNAGWDARTRRLGTFARARGVGDCGTTQRYAWDGTRFRLVERMDMGECRGSTDFITTWRARAVTR
ncbi:MAG TPA: DUF1176 domain-containing protein [Sphingomonadaceae bacterium]|nr:DUF1176 domain-containing protein [Sphingomonadaceae bacterium]